MKARLKLLIVVFGIGFVSALVLAERWRRIGAPAASSGAADLAADEAASEDGGAVATVKRRFLRPIAHGASNDIGWLRSKLRRNGDSADPEDEVDLVHPPVELLEAVGGFPEQAVPEPSVDDEPSGDGEPSADEPGVEDGEPD